jgi:hypothetical protein
MGWLFSNNFNPNRRIELDKQFTWASETARCRVLKSAMVGTTYYAAIEYTIEETGERKVFAAVALTEASRDGGWGYKDMDETVGPYETRCPASILDLLSPTDNQYALEWRQRCREYIARKKAAPKPVAGAIVTYGGHQYRLDCPAPKASLGWHVTRVSDGRAFRMKAHQVRSALNA